MQEVFDNELLTDLTVVHFGRWHTWHGFGRRSGPIGRGT